MPSVKLYGRRWHFSTDVVAIPALLSGLFHTAWLIIVLAWAGATGAWPGHCTSSDGLQYAVLFGGLLATFAANLVLDVLLVYHSLQGAPFEVSKRRWVVMLLYTATVPLVCTLGFTVYGSYVSTHLEPNCWPNIQRNAVTNLAQGLVFSTWGFMALASLGIALTYNMYPQHHDLSSWEARCECLASALCCHANIMRRPDGKRAPLTNIAELTAGLLSHCDLDATDITAALFLAAAAQNRRRRLRVAKALLPVYKALRSTTASITSDERSSVNNEEHDDASSTVSFLDDVPADRELDRMVGEQRVQRERLQLHGAALGPQTPAHGAPAPTGSRPQRQVRSAKAVSWAQDALKPAAGQAAAAGQGLVMASADAGPPDFRGISLPSLALQQQQQRQQQQGREEAGPQATVADTGSHAPSRCVEPAASLPLTWDNVAMLDERVSLMEEGGSPHTDQIQTAAEVVAGKLLADLSKELPEHHAEILDQLATAIESEIEHLGGRQQVAADAVLEVSKGESLDLSALELDPYAPSIWFSTASSRRAATGDGLSSRGSSVSRVAEGVGGGGEGSHAGATGLGEEEALAATSPFYTAGGGAQHSRSSTASEGDGSEPTKAVVHAAAVEAAAAIALAGDSLRHYTGDAAAAAGGPAAATVGEAEALEEAPRAVDGASLPAPEAVPPAADETAVAAVAAAAGSSPKSAWQAPPTAGDSEAAPSSQQLDLEKQITVRFPVVITPSGKLPPVGEHVEDFRGVLPASSLADIYAGRHDKVPCAVLKEAVHFLKFSYAVYSLEPKIEAPANGLDVACRACCETPRDPQQVVFKGLSELEELEDDGSVELLHLNCSNRVLAHLPYMICLDHGKQAVVLAIRGTISAADIVTDAVVYPEPLDTWLPLEIKQELSQPAYAHAGMLAAASAIFEDMSERGILQQLVKGEEVGDFIAPEEQRAQRSGAAGPSRSQYDADSGSNAATAEQYRLGSSPRAGEGGGDDKGGSGRRVGSGVGGMSATNVQSRQHSDEWGRLWEGTSRGAAHCDKTGSKGDRQRHESQVPPAGYYHHTMRQHEGHGQREGRQAAERSQELPGRRVGEIMRQKIEDEGWQFIVEGHSLGAGAAALISLKLLEAYPGLNCIAYSCPGGLVSKNLAHAMARFTTTVAVGKDAVPRSTVGNLARLMDEMVTALARCKQPKLKVLLFPWWRHSKAHFSALFHSYDAIPAEPLEVLLQYYHSRARIGQPLSMYPPGRVLFLRPIKTRLSKEWDAVWIEPEDLIGEGLLISPHMLRDHLCSTAYEALTAAAALSEQLESGGASERAGEAAARHHVAASRTPPHRSAQRAVHERWRQRLHMQHTGSLQQVLIEAL